MKGMSCSAIIFFSLSISIYESKNLQLASQQQPQTQVKPAFSRESLKIWTGKSIYKQQLQQRKKMISLPMVDYSTKAQIQQKYKQPADQNVRQRIKFEELRTTQRRKQTPNIPQFQQKQLIQWLKRNQGKSTGQGQYNWKKKDHIVSRPEDYSNQPNIVQKSSKVGKSFPHSANNVLSPNNVEEGGRSRILNFFKPTNKNPKKPNIGKLTVSGPMMSDDTRELISANTKKTVPAAEIKSLAQQLDRIQQKNNEEIKQGDNQNGQEKKKRKLGRRQKPLGRNPYQKERNQTNEHLSNVQTHNEHLQNQNSIKSRIVPDPLHLDPQISSAPPSDYQLTPFLREPMTPTPSSPLPSPLSSPLSSPQLNDHQALSSPQVANQLTLQHTPTKEEGQPMLHMRKSKVTVQQLLNRGGKKPQNNLVFTFDVKEIQQNSNNGAKAQSLQVVSLEVVKSKRSKSRSKSLSKSFSRTHSLHRKHSRKGKSSTTISALEAKLKASEQIVNQNRQRRQQQLQRAQHVMKPYRTHDMNWKDFEIRVSEKRTVDHRPGYSPKKLQVSNKIKELASNFGELASKDQLMSKAHRRNRPSFRRGSLKKRTFKKSVKQGEPQISGLAHNLEQVDEHLDEDVFK